MIGIIRYLRCKGVKTQGIGRRNGFKPLEIPGMKTSHFDGPQGEREMCVADSRFIDHFIIKPRILYPTVAWCGRYYDLCFTDLETEAERIKELEA